MTNKEKEEFQKLQAELEQSRKELEAAKSQNVLMLDDCTRRRQEFEALLLEKQVLSTELVQARTERDDLVIINTGQDERIQKLEEELVALKSELEKEKAARSQALEANGNLRAAIATKSPDQLAAHVRAQIIV
ncbi:MAG: hypothetical protein ABS95_01410 [Verrucomicrobia bacterium SCN 57-15]|nr:MAG: hypothetical protein ABS95_01410 [Verrucomicrobia bacterium SCN 57-15]